MTPRSPSPPATPRSRRRLFALAATVLAVTLLHRGLPTSSHAWHLLAERLYYVPILLAAALLSAGSAAAVTLLASLAYALHILLDWRGQPMIQAEQGANLATFWIVGLTSSVLFQRWKAALQDVAAAHEETLGALAASLELREPYTSGHSQRVRDYTLLLADRLGLRDPEERRRIGEGALFHDIGKIGIPDAILLKSDLLRPEEMEVMRRHPALGADLVGRIGFLREARDLVLSHHERYDGSGYPSGRRGADIPLGARIFAVADAFDAMTSERPYRPALSFEEAVARITEGRGRQFDPDVVDAFLSIDFPRWSGLAASGGVRLRRAAPATAGQSEDPSVSDRRAPL